MGKKRWLYIIWVIGGIYICLVLGQSLWQLVRAGDRVSEAKNELASLQQRGQKLSDRLSQVQSPDFVEKEARDELGMQKPGETVLIVPPVNLPSPKTTGGDSNKIEANWEKWLSLFRD